MENFSFVFIKPQFCTFLLDWSVGAVHVSVLSQYKGSTSHETDAHWNRKSVPNASGLPQLQMRWYESLSPSLSSEKRFRFLTKTQITKLFSLDANWMQPNGLGNLMEEIFSVWCSACVFREKRLFCHQFIGFLSGAPQNYAFFKEFILFRYPEFLFFCGFFSRINFHE